MGLLAASPALGEVTVVQAGDGDLTVVFTVTPENGADHLRQLRLASSLWHICGPEAASSGICDTYGQLYRPDVLCDASRVSEGGCSADEQGSTVQDDRSLEDWMDSFLRRALSAISARGKAILEGELLPENKSGPNDWEARR